MWNQETYLAALAFAARAHGEQRVPGNGFPYVVHLCQVAMEIMALPDGDNLAVCCAVLHDTLEDTDTPYQALVDAFGDSVALGVQALTKDASLPKEQRMADSLERIRRQPKQIWMVKLADRITNLQQPPDSWPTLKRQAYRREAGLILEALGEGHPLLQARLQEKIERYKQWC